MRVQDRISTALSVRISQQEIRFSRFIAGRSGTGRAESTDTAVLGRDRDGTGQTALTEVPGEITEAERHQLRMDVDHLEATKRQTEADLDSLDHAVREKDAELSDKSRAIAQSAHKGRPIYAGPPLGKPNERAANQSPRIAPETIRIKRYEIVPQMGQLVDVLM